MNTIILLEIGLLLTPISGQGLSAGHCDLRRCLTNLPRLDLMEESMQSLHHNTPLARETRNERRVARDNVGIRYPLIAVELRNKCRFISQMHDLELTLKVKVSRSAVAVLRDCSHEQLLV